MQSFSDFKCTVVFRLQKPNRFFCPRGQVSDSNTGQIFVRGNRFPISRRGNFFTPRWAFSNRKNWISPPPCGSRFGAQRISPRKQTWRQHERQFPPGGEVGSPRASARRARRQELESPSACQGAPALLLQRSHWRARPRPHDFAPRRGVPPARGGGSGDPAGPEFWCSWVGNWLRFRGQFPSSINGHSPTPHLGTDIDDGFGVSFRQQIRGHLLIPNLDSLTGSYSGPIFGVNFRPHIRGPFPTPNMGLDHHHGLGVGN